MKKRYRIPLFVGAFLFALASIWLGAWGFHAATIYEMKWVEFPSFITGLICFATGCGGIAGVAANWNEFK